MGLSDKLLGSAMLATAAFVFIYFTTWTIILPFFPPDHPVNAFFLSREWAFRIPAFLIVLGLSGVTFFVATVLRDERRKQERKRIAKSA